MFAIVVRFELHPSRAVEFDALMAQTVPAIGEAEPGTQIYVCCRVTGAPFSRVFMEIYADRAAFEAHERAPATLRFLTERTSLVASTRVEFLEPYEWTIAPAPASPDAAGLTGL